jgi:hypothetical protein
MTLLPQNELRHRVRSVTTHKDPQPSTRIDIPEETTREQPEPSVQGGNGYPEHAKRLTTYAKTATLITFSLIVAFYTTKLDTEENKLFILASFTSLMFTLLFVLVLVMLIGCVERPDPDPKCLRCRFEEKLYISIYGSNWLLMLTAFFLLLLCTFRYAYLAVFLIVALLVICILLIQGSKLKHTESIKKYRELHDSELNHFSELSSAVVLMLFAGLSSIVFSSPNLSRKNDQIKVTECFLYVIIVLSLLLMLLTSVPPAVQYNGTRSRMVRVVKFLFYTLISILTLVGLMAASEVLQGLVVFSTFAHIIGATYWLVTEILYEHPDHNQDQGRAQPVEKMELDSLSMVFATGAFSALMVVYSRNVDNSEPYSWCYYLILAVCMISLCSTFISCLSKMVFFTHALQTRAWEKAETILSNITYISLFVALFSTTVLAVYSGLTSKKSSN